MRKLTQEDFFSMKEFHVAVLHAFFDGKLSNYLGCHYIAFKSQSKEMKHQYFDKQMLIEITDETIGQDKDATEPNVQNVHFVETLDLWERYFNMKNVLKSITLFVSEHRQVTLLIAIELDTWEKLLREKTLKIHSKEVLKLT